MTSLDSRDDHDWLSGSYVDEWVDDWSQRGERAAQLRRVAVAIPINREDRIAILDIGGGWGPLTEEVLAYRPNATVTLADYSPPMLEHARERLARHSGQVKFEQRDLTDPKWSEGLGGPFDAVISSLAIHNLRDPTVITRVYRDIFGLVRPGGCFCNLEVVIAAGPNVAMVARRIRADEQGDDPDAIESVPAVTSGDGNRPSADQQPAPRSLESQLRWLREAGFNDVDCLWRNGNLGLLYGARSTD